ncbi:MAG TPA: SDR family oxidoreductase, partial [Nitrospiria bacterium]|nr:SDR family oxidoreductase [Nitrospiria bacterium]
SLLQELEGQYPGKFGVFKADLVSEKAVSDMVGEVLRFFGRVDVLVNSGGIIAYGPFESLDPRTLREVMEVNYWGTVACIRSVLPHMIKQKSGHIVNMASTAGRRGFPMETGYCASKFAVVGFSEALRLELEGSGVGVSVICPGIVDTPMAGSFLDIPGIRERVRPLSPEEVASWILKSIENNFPEITRPLSTKLVSLLSGVFPKAADSIILRRTRRLEAIINQNNAKD